MNRIRRRSAGTSLVVAVLVAAGLQVVAAPVARADASSPCGANVNPIVCENRQTGTPESVWDDTDGAGDASIQGFTTDVSTNVGGRVDFKISTPATSYKIEIYRLGYYQGNGARLMGTIAPSATLPQTQPTCTSDTSTQLYDCGNWAVSASWNVPTTAVSGIYIADLRRTDSSSDNSQVPFVVRNDASHSDVLFQTSDATWQAYNTYGGSDFYTGNQQLTDSQARAFKISYNRPYSTRGDNNGRDYLFSNEFPTLRFLERNGYDVSYSTDVDTDRYGSLLTNHKTFLSVGHDEYWSQKQRDNVVAARDQGLNLMFLSGNEMYWRTRYEPSIDGSATAYRTISCYKETWDNAPTDPVDGSTSTFRDPRFKTGSLGGNPENAVTGTLFMANQDDLAISVSGAEGKLRLWRNTTLGQVSDTTVTKLAAHTIGYESDEDLDNGSRPAGLVDLSTTVGSAPMYLQDFGLQTAPGTTTHHLTLYRAASGALVFGAGTIQWGWGLDADHDGFATLAADTRIQQATVNMLADMKSLATTIQSGLVGATTTTDTAAPTVTVSSPASGASIGNGTVLTVSGTATDNGGGQVAGVEVSLDGGATWHPAAGRGSWTYTGVLHGAGSTAVQVRATDDSGNISTPTSQPVTVSCPCTIFGLAAPAKADGGDASAVTLGTRFTSDTDAYVTGIRFYKASTNTGTHVGTLWSASGTVLAKGSFASESASGWQTLTFSSPVAVTAGTTYLAGYYAPKGHYSATTNTFLYRDFNATPLHAAPYSPGVDQVAGVYSSGNAFPISTYMASSYWVDPVLSVTNPLPPTVTSVTPRSGATGATGRTISASFGGPVAPVSVSMTVTNGSGSSVSGTTSYDSPSNTATFTLPAAFDTGAVYNVSLSATGTNGVPMSQPYTWSFRAAGATDGSCPCSLYPDTAVPTTAEDPDTDGVELGFTFTADTAGQVAGVEFYKSPGNAGPHVVTLWSSTGTSLATATSSQETASGWQYVAFASPVAVTAGTSYTASYHAPSGHYSSNASDLTTGLDVFPLHIPAKGARYTYGTGAPTTASASSYGVDVQFVVPSSTQPAVGTIAPASGATGVPTGTTVSATYGDSVTTGSTVVSVTDANGVAVAGTTSLDPTQKTVTFSPSSALTTGVTYQVSVSGARGLGGGTQAAAKTWSFSTGTGSALPAGSGLFATNAVPSTIDSGDASGVSLGMKFSSSTAGTVTGVRFYKASANTGTHTVSLWSASGSRLATATVSGESTSGWQYATFASAVAITAGTTYVVSYYAPKGHYAVNSNYFSQAATNGSLTAPSGTNGVYVYGSDAFPSSSYGSSNYWVDPYVVTSAGAAAVVSQSPPAGTSSVAATTAPSTAYSADLSASTALATVTQKVGSATATTVAGTTSYAASTRTVTFTPSAAFTAGATVSVSVTAKLADGTTAAPTSSWTFVVAKADPAPGVCPCALHPDSSVPATVTVNDPAGVELGTAFTADVAGQVTGVSFYKGPRNTGTHTVYLYDASGNRLATATASGESTSGWQTATFTTAVTLTAGATYVASYFTSVGYYSATSNGWANGLDVSPLHVAAGSSGRYVYRAASATTVPTTTSSADYWVTPVFTRTNTGP